MTRRLLKALIVTHTPHWMSVARLVPRLAEQGVEVHVVCQQGALITLSEGLAGGVALTPGLPMETFGNTVYQEALRLRPDLLIPGEDRVVQLLHDVYARLGDGEDEAFMRALIERSLGDPAHYADIERKSALVEMAARTGVPIPQSRVVATEEDAEAFAEALGYPVLLKPDHGVGGAGITLCDGPAGLRQAFAQALARPLGARREAPALTVQRFVQGPTASVTLLAWQGRLLAGFSWLRRHPYPNAFGLASQLELFPSPVMLERAARVVEHFGYSGLGSVQFVIDEQRNEPLVMEINARATPVANLGGLLGVDLIGGLCATLRGESLPPVTEPRYRRVAFFPNELLRDPNSPDLHNMAVYHDVPRDQPRLLAHLNESLKLRGAPRHSN